MASKAVVADEYELILLRLLDEEYTRHPFLRQPENGSLARHPGAHCKPQACSAFDGNTGLVAMAPGPKYQQKNIRSTKFILICSEGWILSDQIRFGAPNITYVRLAPWFCVSGGDHRTGIGRF